MREESTIRRWVTLTRDMSDIVAEHIEKYPWVPMNWICGNKYIVGSGATAHDKLKDEFAVAAFDLAAEKQMSGEHVCAHPTDPMYVYAYVLISVLVTVLVTVVDAAAVAVGVAVLAAKAMLSSFLLLLFLMSLLLCFSEGAVCGAPGVAFFCGGVMRSSPLPFDPETTWPSPGTALPPHPTHEPTHADPFKKHATSRNLSIGSRLRHGILHAHEDIGEVA